MAAETTKLAMFVSGKTNTTIEEHTISGASDHMSDIRNTNEIPEDTEQNRGIVAKITNRFRSDHA